MKSRTWTPVVATLLTLPCFAQWQDTGTMIPGQPVCLSPSCFIQQQWVVDGKPIPGATIIIRFFPPNTPPPWLADLWEYTNVALDLDVNKGPVAQCINWLQEVNDWESKHGKDTPYLLIQLNESANYQQVQDDYGNWFWPPGSVTCYPILNGWAP